jgi:hypothetical protein
VRSPLNPLPCFIASTRECEQGIAESLVSSGDIWNREVLSYAHPRIGTGAFAPVRTPIGEWLPNGS